MKRFSTISFTALAIASLSAAASAQTAPGAATGTPAPEPGTSADTTATSTPTDAPGSEIIVTGTRRTDRTVAESPVPVDVFDATTLQTQAPADMNSVLRNLIPSFNVGRFTTSDGSAFVRPPTLRGLPPDEILVLVNGKRRHRSALVQLSGGSLAAGSQGPDLAQIPIIAIERIEVLRDGAAAQYGSDAIAGVLNYGLKRNREGISMTARYGQTYRGDGESTQVAGNIGLPLGEGFISLSGEFVDANQTSRGVQRAGAAALALARPDLAGGVPNPAQIIGDPKVRSYRGFLNAGLPVGDDGEVYLFGNYGESRTEIDFNYRQPVTVTGPNRFGNGTASYGYASGVYETLYLDRLANGNYSSTGRTFNFTSLFPSGFTPRFKGHITDLSSVGGYKGKTGFDLSYDFSVSYGQSRIDYNMTNTVNPSQGPTSPTAFYLGRLEQRETNFNADFAYPIELGLASPLTVAFGGEHRREAYAIEVGDPASYAVGPYAFQRVQRPDGTTFTVTQQVGANGFPGYGPDAAVDNARKSYAAYLDVETDLTEGLSVGGAIRYEHFSDFGSTTNVKGTARYEFSPALAIRGAASTGFRAPTPGQLFTTNIATAFVGGNPVETATLPPGNAAARFFGASTLKPETAENYSAGLVVTPMSNLTATLDFYLINVKDRIGLSGNFDITTQSQRDQLAALGVTNAASLGRVRYFTNAFDTRTKGIDLVINHTLNTDYGRFATTFAGNYNTTKVTEFNPVIITRERRGDIENLNPHYRANLSENWTLDQFGVLLRGNYFGNYTSFDIPANGGDLKFGSEVTFDVEVSYEITDSIRIAAGAENVFNEYPDRNFRAAGGTGVPATAPLQNFYTFTDATVTGSRYLGDSPFGFNGGFWYGRASLNF
jgi:iron complex outermembrane receptor protein